MRHIIFLGCEKGKCFLIEGVNVFNFSWKPTGECTTVIHPDTKEIYTFTIYTCDIGDSIIKFACGSFGKTGKAFYKIID